MDCVLFILSFLLRRLFCLFFFSFISTSWRPTTLQYCSGFCHTLTWISHGDTCIPHPDPPSRLPCFYSYLISCQNACYMVYGTSPWSIRCFPALQILPTETNSWPLTVHTHTNLPLGKFPGWNCWISFARYLPDECNQMLYFPYFEWRWISFFHLNKKKSLILFLAVLDLCCRSWPFPSCGQWGPLSNCGVFL